MPDYDDDLDNGADDTDSDRNPLRAQLKRMEKDLKAAREQATAGQDAARKLAFMEAGVDLKAPGAKYFVKGYDGDLTADAIKAAALEEGFLKEPDKDVVTDAEKAGLQEIDRASAGGSAPGGRDIGAEMRALEQRTDINVTQKKVELDKLVRAAGIPIQA